VIIRVRVDDRRYSSVVLGLQVRRKGISCRKQPGARSDPLLEVERIKLVWMQREEERKRRTYRGKAQQELRRQRGPERQRRSKAAYGQENRKAQQERGVVERRSGEPLKC